VPPDVRDALLAKGAQVGNMYGLTEAMPVCVTGPSLYYGDELAVPVGSSGRPSKAFCTAVLKDPDTGETLEGNDVEGEVCIRGDVVTPGYYRDPRRTAEAFDAEGFLHTRDRAYRDSEGWWYVRGRTDDIIKPGGEKLSLLEVDAALIAHPDVHDAGCVGVAHDRFGEVPAAFVALRRDLTDREARDLLDAHCLATLERWKRPRLYVFVEEVPRTPAKRSKMAATMKRGSRAWWYATRMASRHSASSQRVRRDPRDQQPVRRSARYPPPGRAGGARSVQNGSTGRRGVQRRRTGHGEHAGDDRSARAGGATRVHRGSLRTDRPAVRGQRAGRA
jgi:acyl-CoA synthetase (AMP-forming)/AMP-acid ligase II